MILRRILVAAVAALAASASLAQTQLLQTGKAPGTTPDQEYARESLAASSDSLAISRLAAKKVELDDLREFARFEEGEQEILRDVLMSALSPDAVRNERSIRRPGDAEVEQHLSQRGREILERLRTAPAGAEFDRAYLGAVATGHLELLRIQETYLDSGQNNANLVSVAKLARGMIKEHLQLLTDIETGMDTVSGLTTGAGPGRGR